MALGTQVTFGQLSVVGNASAQTFTGTAAVISAFDTSGALAPASGTGAVGPNSDNVTVSTSADTITVNEAGIYLVNLYLAALTGGTAGSLTISLRRNGTAFGPVATQWAKDGGAAIRDFLNMSTIIQLEKGDVIAVYGLLATGTTNHTITDGSLSVRRIG